MSTATVTLTLDTATLGGSVCLASDEKILASVIADPQISHSHSLLRDITEALEIAGRTLVEVDLFAAACGPGSFTGLRIGLATTKALSMNLNRPCVGIPTLQAIAHSAGESEATVATLSAGRGEVYAQLLSVNSEGTVVELDAPAPLSPDAMIERYSALANLTWVGGGAQSHRDVIRQAASKEGIEFCDQSSTLKDASRGWVLVRCEANLSQHISALALQKLRHGSVVTPAALQANYVRLSDAELRKQCH